MILFAEWLRSCYEHHIPKISQCISEARRTVWASALLARRRTAPSLSFQFMHASRVKVRKNNNKGMIPASVQPCFTSLSFWHVQHCIITILLYAEKSFSLNLSSRYLNPEYALYRCITVLSLPSRSTVTITHVCRRAAVLYVVCDIAKWTLPSTPRCRVHSFVCEFRMQIYAKVTGVITMARIKTHCPVLYSCATG